jgi:hypothetical protein
MSTAAPTPPDSVVAVNLSAAINTAFDEARGLADNARADARQAVVRALECGRLLSLQKAALAHGGWLPWLAVHCPGISPVTAQRYMRLAKRHGVTGIMDGAGLRQAYLATGVLPESERTRRAIDAKTPTISFVRGLDIFRRWLNQRTRELPVESWTPDARRAVRHEIAWIIRLDEDLDDDEPEDTQRRPQ